MQDIQDISIIIMNITLICISFMLPGVQIIHNIHIHVHNIGKDSRAAKIRYN